MLHGQNTMLTSVMHALPNRADLLNNLNEGHQGMLKALKDADQSAEVIAGAEAVYDAAMMSLGPGGHTDKERITGLVDQIAASRNGVLVLINLLASQPGIDAELLVDELEEALATPNVMLNPPTQPLLEQMLEIVRRRNPDIQTT